MKKLILIFCILCLTGCGSEQVELKTDSKENDVIEQNNSVSNVQEQNKVEEKENGNNEEVANSTPVEQTKEQTIATEQPIKKEEVVIAHFEQEEKEIATLLSEQQNDSIKEQIAQKFILIVDFIYYGSEINGVTFNELTESAQNKIKALASRIDESINAKIPNYKETLQEKYKKAVSYLKEKATTLGETISEKVEETIGTDNYNNFKEAKDVLVETTKDTISKIGDVSSEVYENGKEKTKNWYENLKEKYGNEKENQ